MKLCTLHFPSLMLGKSMLLLRGYLSKISLYKLSLPRQIFDFSTRLIVQCYCIDQRTEVILRRASANCREGDRSQEGTQDTHSAGRRCPSPPALYRGAPPWLYRGVPPSCGVLFLFHPPIFEPILCIQRLKKFNAKDRY